MVDKTGRSVKKNANKFKGVVANRTMDDAGRLVHIKLRWDINGYTRQKKHIQTHHSTGLTEEAMHDLGALAIAPPSSLSIQTFRHDIKQCLEEAWPVRRRLPEAQRQAATRLVQKKKLNTSYY
jgi:hypothetical protein